MLHARFDCPIISLARVVLRSLLLDEMLVQTEVVPNAVLPTGILGAVEGEVIRDPLVDLGERKSSLSGSEDCHADELSITVSRLRSVVDNRRERVVWRKR
jgi:hypothetical protein